MKRRPTISHLSPLRTDRSLSINDTRNCSCWGGHNWEQLSILIQTIELFQTTSLHLKWLESIRLSQCCTSNLNHMSRDDDLEFCRLWSKKFTDRNKQDDLREYFDSNVKQRNTILTLPPITIWCPPQPWSVPAEVFGVVVLPNSLETTTVILSHRPRLTNSSRKPFSTEPIVVNLALSTFLRSKWVSKPPIETANESLFTSRLSSVLKINSRYQAWDWLSALW